MTLALRPKDSSDHRMYAPARDIAYCFPELCRAAIHGLTETNIEVWFSDMLESKEVTCEELSKLVGIVAETARLFAVDDTKSPADALTKAGFLTLKPCIQATFYCKLGQALMGAAFKGIRDTLPEGADPPVTLTSLKDAAIEAQKVLEEKAAQFDSLKVDISCFRLEPSKTIPQNNQ